MGDSRGAYLAVWYRYLSVNFSGEPIEQTYDDYVERIIAERRSREVGNWTLHENNEIDLADQANLLFWTNDPKNNDLVVDVDLNDSEASLVALQDDILAWVSIYADPDSNGEVAMSYSDVSDLMPELGAEAVSLLD